MITYSFVIVEKAATKPPFHNVDVYLQVENDNTTAVELSLAEMIDRTIRQLLKSDSPHFFLRKDCHLKVASNKN